MPEPVVVIPAVKIFSVKEERTLAEIKESIRQAYDATHQRLRAEAGAAFPRVYAEPFTGVVNLDDFQPIPTVWEAERLANLLDLPPLLLNRSEC